MIPALLAFAVGLIIGRLTRRKVVRHGSGAYFLKRREVWPVMAAWNADAVRQQAARRQ